MLIALFHFVHYSAEMRWPENEGAITIKLKVRQSSSADWFGIGFSTGYLMVQKLYQCHFGLHNISKFLLYIRNNAILKITCMNKSRLCFPYRVMV